MKKFFLLAMASLMTIFVMAEEPDGSTKANAIDFDWEKGITHPGGNQKLWYRVSLDPLYQEDNPSLTLYLTNPSNEVGTSVDVSMVATVAKQVESKDYTIAARQYKTYTANASMLVRMQQTEIYLTLKASGIVKLSAKVFESADLDETCKDAETLKWYTTTTQNPMYSKWWKINIAQIKDTAKMKKDARVVIKNLGTKTVNLKAGQSLDCPSSGTTRRDYAIAANDSIVDTIPQSMITSVQPDEIYFGLENVEAKISIRVDTIAQPVDPIIDGPDKLAAIAPYVNPADTVKYGVPAETAMKGLTIPVGTTLYRYSVKDLNAFSKYEPEFTYRNAGSVAANVTIKMAFERPAYGTSNTNYEIAANEEEVVVYKKNMLDGMSGVDSIYLLTTTDQPITFLARYKHVREGKACKTNIEFNWETGHFQEARTTQWYAIDVADAKDSAKDIMVYVSNQSSATASVHASVAFTCPYIDLQEITRSIAAGDTVKRRLGFSTYAMMTDVIYIGLETSQDIKFWVDTIDTQKKAIADTICLAADTFKWEGGVKQKAGDTVWYVVNMEEVRELAAKFPTVQIQNYGSSEATIKSELSLECPDSIENESRSLKIAANGMYSKQLSSNLFANIKRPEIYLKVITDQDISMEILLTEKPAGSDCSSAIPFNWVSGNTQAASANLWYSVDLRNAMKRGNDLKLHIKNMDNKKGAAVAQMVYTCPVEETPSVQNFTLGANAQKDITVQNSALETLQDSIIYINLQGETKLHFWADTLEVVPFDTIFGASPITPIQWDSTYTQTVDTAWYIIPKSEIDKVRNMDEKVKPVGHLYNLSGAEMTIKSEAAYAFPIVKNMMSKSQKIKAGAHFSDTVPASLFEQLIKTDTKNQKDSVLLRITRPVGAGNFQFRTELVKAFGGNSKYDAVPIVMGKNFSQSPNTEMWYKIKTADWKKDKSLVGKSLNINTKNAGKGDAEVTVAIYEGLLDTTNLIEYYTGDAKRGKRTIKKGQGKSHNFPAQAVYALGDMEMYLKVRTTDSLVFESTFLDYAPIDTATAGIDTTQQKAKMVVPNVWYELPADTTMWFFVCAPYIQNNFKYIDASNLEYELEGKAPANIEITSTFQDTLTYKVPVRTRTINKSGTERKGQRPLKELLNEAIERAGQDFDISGFKETFIDSMLHRYLTKDSVTAYIRVRSDKNVKLRLNTPRTKGDSCMKAMEFDWEHGIVNPAKETTWVHVDLDSTRVPKDKDLKLHMDNWSKDSTGVAAVVYEEDCKGIELGRVNKRKILNDTTKTINREVLALWGWADLMIEYYSDSATHLWAELIDKAIPDTLRDTVSMVVCAGDPYTDKYLDTIINKDLKWHTDTMDSIVKAEMTLYKYIKYYDFKVYRDPKLLLIDSLNNAPVVNKDSILDLSAATAELKAYFDSLEIADTTKHVGAGDSIKWEYTTDGLTFTAVPTTALDTAVIGLRYIITTTCNGKDTSVVWKNIPTFAIDTAACMTFTWDLNGKTYCVKGACSGSGLAPGKYTNLDTVHVPVGVSLEKIMQLNLTITEDVFDTIAKDTVDTCNYYIWRGKEYAKTDVYYDYDTTVTATGCNYIKVYKLDLKISNPKVFNINAVSRYGNRLLIINRLQIIDSIGWALDSIYDPTGLVKVEWYEKVAGGTDKLVGNGYYYNLADGEPLVGTFYAKVTVPAGSGSCGYLGQTIDLVCKPANSAAPALIPSLARSGEDIRIVNLDPTQTTTVRVYTSQGMVRETFTVNGEDSYIFKAAAEQGFYLVELIGEDMQTTLRYIVK